MAAAMISLQAFCGDTVKRLKCDNHCSLAELRGLLRVTYHKTGTFSSVSYRQCLREIEIDSEDRWQDALHFALTGGGRMLRLQVRLSSLVCLGQADAGLRWFHLFCNKGIS